MEFIATCPRAFEGLLADELKTLGTDGVRPLTGQVAFSGSLEDALRVCMWSRIASRVVLVLSRFDAHDADALYGGIAAVAWEDHMSGAASFAFDAHGENSALRNTRFIAEKSKDALVDRMLAQTGTRPQVEVRNPQLSYVVRISGERGMVGLALSGSRPLFDRSQSVQGPSGPRADYAAGLVSLAGVSGAREALVLWGGPTLGVETAGALAGRAPGLVRARWGFERWLGMDEAAWKRVADAARDRATEPVRLLVFDPHDRRSALEHALRAEGITATVERVSEVGLDKALENAVPAVADLTFTKGDAAFEATLVSPLSKIARAAKEGTALATLGSAGIAEAALGCAPTQTLETRLGSSDVRLARFELPGAGCAEVTLASGETLGVLVGASDQFAARLTKVYKQRSREAENDFISCYRVYDADLPDYNVAIDLLSPLDGGAPWAVVAEYAAPAGVDATLARKRLVDVLAITPRVLGVPTKQLVCRVRERSRGGSQYADTDEKAKPKRLLIDEGGLAFELELSRRHDYGIFLDHRDTRSMLREMMKAAGGEKRFLNLFCYTGTATAYAVDGGAKASVSVDLSKPSLEVARKNLERNGLAGDEHRFIQADVLQWVQDRRHMRGSERFELIFCDVPTFSNSQRMRKSSFDVQRDHAELLISVSRLLAKGGTCVFSCNLRNFKPDVAALAKAGVTIEDITPETIPFDFARTPKVHHCYLVRRT